MSFKWKNNGTWYHKKNESNEAWDMIVSLLNGEVDGIEHLSVNEAVKTLGSMSCPSGNNLAALSRMLTQ